MIFWVDKKKEYKEPNPEKCRNFKDKFLSDE
jgi:hypothetical protein